MDSKVPKSWKHGVRRHAKALGSIATVVGLVIGSVALWKGEHWRVQHIDEAYVYGFHWFFILYLGWLVITHECPRFFGIPRVQVVLRNESMLLVEKADWLGIGVITRIYALEDDYERLVCLGEVVNVQMNGLVQIAIQMSDDGYRSEQDVWSCLDRIDKKMLLVKPGSFRGVS